jgi:dCMP deaminase
VPLQTLDCGCMQKLPAPMGSSSIVNVKRGCPKHDPGGDRPTRDESFMEIAEVMAKRSTCLRGQTAALIVQDKRIVATGYNGAPPGMDTCVELKECDTLTVMPVDLPPGDFHDEYMELGCQRAIHAELNAIAFAARWGARCQDATMYCLSAPCLRCAQAIISAGITTVIYKNEYRAQRIDLLEEAGVRVMHFVGQA